MSTFKQLGASQYVNIEKFVSVKISQGDRRFHEDENLYYIRGVLPNLKLVTIFSGDKETCEKELAKLLGLKDNSQTVLF